MKRLHILALTCVCLGIAAMLLFRVNTRAIAARPSSCGAWNVVPSPNAPGNVNTGNTNTLSGVATIAANDIWAVGDSYPDRETPSRTLTEHWNGTKWSIVPSPNVPSGYNYLNGVTEVSSNDVWAVGMVANTGGNETLIEHWNGATWSIVPSPTPDSSTNVAPALQTFNVNSLNGVAAVSATDIWAVGQSYGYQALIEHWNGVQWSIVPSPTNLPYVTLSGVTAISTSNVWVVGDYNANEKNYTLVEHWDGTQWSIVHSPNPSSYGAITFYGVAAVSANNIWAVGEYGSNSIHHGVALIEHWNGTKWSIVPGAPTSEQVALLAVTVISPTNIWAVGDTYSNTTFTEHWNGTAWSIVPSPNPAKFYSSFNAVASIPSSNYVWAVGNATYITTTDQFPTNTLTAYYC